MLLITRGSFLIAVTAMLFLVVPNAYPASLTTTFSSNNSMNGNMFEINAINSVIIKSFDGNLQPPSQNMLIYYRPGSYTGFELSSAGWTLVGTANGVVSNGDDVATPIPIPVNVTIPAGQTYSFYITTDGSGPNGRINYTDGTTEHAVYVSDSNIQILEGIGVEYPFADTFVPRIWNGTVHYDLPSVAVPTMNEWGMIIFICLAGLGSIYYLQRQRRSES